MRILLAALMLTLVSLPALADSIAVNGRLVTDGDGAAKVLQVLGTPDRIVQLETEYGGATGERWEYYRGEKTILIEVFGGKVKSIAETR